MGILSGVLTVFFIILCVLLVILILLQSDKSSGMGLLGGSSQSTFGSSTADIITKVSSVMVALFFLIGIALAAIEAVKVRSLSEGISGAPVNSGTISNQAAPVDAAAKPADAVPAQKPGAAK